MELFAGSARVTKALRRLGYGCVPIDIDYGVEFDLFNSEVSDRIIGWIRGGCICGVFLGTPCSSWSVARHGPPGSNWCALRSASHIYGLPGLGTADRQKNKTGNTAMRVTARFIKETTNLGVPTMLENPVSSRLFAAPPISRVCGGASVRQVFDMCSLGTRWRKRTRIQTWGCQPISDVACCRGRNHMCSFSNRAHIELAGKNSQGVFWTSLAQVYPLKLAFRIAKCLIDASSSRAWHASLIRANCV